MLITDALRRALEGGGADRVLTLDRAFQGLPDTAHGGSVLAAFDLAAARPGPRALHGHYRKRVPLGVPLRVRVSDDAARFELFENGSLLVDARVADIGGAVTTARGAGTAGAAGGSARPSASGSAEPPAASAVPAPPDDALALPISRACFACGVDNPLGLGVRLRADATTVGGTWTPRPGFRAEDGTLAPVALTTLLDEGAFWLGALASGEAGMTTELRIVLHVSAPADSPITVVGARAAVRARVDDPRYWETVLTARDAAGRVVAGAAITFVAVRGAARRLVSGMLALNPPAVLRQVFPAYAPPA